MDIATTSAVERIARVLAGQRLSVNAGGTETSPSAHVDATWRDYLDDALAVLRTLREPDRAMTAAGDAAIWEAMVLAAIAQGQPRAM